jgi:nicotinamide mononucleotide transporter
MWLLARKKIENWILWIAGDFISIFLFAYEKLYFSSFQFLVFTVIAVFGFLEWRRKLVRRAEYGGRRLEVKGQKSEVRGKRTAKSE